MPNCRDCALGLEPVWFTTDKGPADEADTDVLSDRIWCSYQEMLVFNSQEVCDEYEEG